MALANWNQGMDLPALPTLPNFHVTINAETRLLASLTGLSETEIETRKRNNHRPAVAWLNETPVGYGWIATESAEIGELDLSFTLPPESVYLWDFATLSAWRGLGIYPHLLQEIVMQERQEAHSFWIIHAPENQASARGITRAGFSAVGELSFMKQTRGVGLMSSSPASIAYEGAQLLHVELLNQPADDALAPCWCCVIGHVETPDCWTTACRCSAS
jgi:GNAT superfamily N-acetyltransferase